MITVSSIYAICWVPVLVMYCLAQSLPNMMVLSHQHKVTILLAMFNSSINPVVYSFTSARFRKHLVKLLRCKCHSKNSEKQLKPLAKKSQPTTSDGMWTTIVEKKVSGACMKLHLITVCCLWSRLWLENLHVMGYLPYILWLLKISSSIKILLNQISSFGMTFYSLSLVCWWTADFELVADTVLFC